MSGLLTLSSYLGEDVSGSDKNYSETLLRLKNEGYDVYVGHDPLKASAADLVVYSGAVEEIDTELNAAKTKIERGAYLGKISRNFKECVAVAGAHGKTTISAMISHVLHKTKARFCCHFGGEFVEPIEKYNGTDIFVTEACEYRNSFLSLFPDYAIIANVEYDHPDFFPSFDEMKHSFQRFASQTQKVLVLGKNANVCAGGHTTTLKEERDFSIKILDDNECAFALSLENDIQAFYLPNEILRHNMTNAAYAAVILQKMGIAVETTAEALESFKGVKRRMEYLGKYKNADAYLDYAHHPTQIAEVINCAKRKYKKVFTVFQPHTYSRTKAFLSDFAKALDNSDAVNLLDVYAAREKYDETASSRILFDKLSVREKYMDSDLKDFPYTATKDSAILFLGAGDIDDIARTLIKFG
ncbi:MAG: hypothetical protein IJS93_00250 [Clostridia bacterium]|nr:hypothetical protein [Clostridia bacterium]